MTARHLTVEAGAAGRRAGLVLLSQRGAGGVVEGFDRRRSIDEVWHRDGKGSVIFERVFHEDQRAVDYTAGELATIGISEVSSAFPSFILRDHPPA